MKDQPNRVLLGRIAGAHGIRGEVLIRTFTSDPEGIAAYGALSDREGGRKFELTVMRVTDKGVVARVAGISDRNSAEALNGIELFVDRGMLPPPSDGELYHVDLVGLAACNPDGQPLGEVVSVQNFGGGDLLEIALLATGRTELIPFTKAFVPDIDIPGRRLIVSPAALPAASAERVHSLSSRRVRAKPERKPGPST